MKALFFGDVVGRPGRTALAKILSSWNKKFKPDFLLANGENLAHGDGVTPQTLEEVLALGFDAITSGNHIFHKKEAVELLNDPSKKLLRPYNMTGETLAGRGWLVAEKNRMKLAVANLIGVIQFKPHTYSNPFVEAGKMLAQIYSQYPGIPILVDFHAEATSEKKAMGWFLDGKVSAIIGTHTHVPTRDERILPNGSAYITDVGMVGVADSVLGVEKESVISNFLQEPHVGIDLAEGPVEVNAVLVEIEETTQKSLGITHISEIVKV